MRKLGRYRRIGENDYANEYECLTCRKNYEVAFDKSFSYCPMCGVHLLGHFKRNKRWNLPGNWYPQIRVEFWYEYGKHWHFSNCAMSIVHEYKRDPNCYKNIMRNIRTYLVNSAVRIIVKHKDGTEKILKEIGCAK